MYEIQLDQRARIPLDLKDKQLWLAILNEEGMAKLGSYKERKGDVMLSILDNAG